ncbi:hypothetical protein WR25_12709 isoform I [Diploscapter pachys]|uniref:LIM interaction domain-containing protein n=1 Tax=Diploscapter pachys TaxID=2018661 RepID=A0A2A2LLS5_9BILA|nr:hypothetical protein WR25_12709 isoform I [Diploscapter pachys]
MPRRRAPIIDGAPPPVKAPRVRKKKTDIEPKPLQPAPDPYDPTGGGALMQMQNGYAAMDDGSMYTQDAYGYAFGAQPPFASPESSGSPYVMTPQNGTPQPPSHQIMMRPPMAPPSQPSSMGVPPQMPQSSHLVGPAPSPLEFRIHEMNRRLYIFSNSGVSEKDFAQWWDAFSHEFFDDDARIWFILLDDPTNPEKYAVGRQLIPRFFRSIFDSGTKELYYVLRGHTRESSMQHCYVLENDNVLQVSKMENNLEVQTECKITIEFAPYDELLNHRIRCMTLELRGCSEFVQNENTKEYEPLLDDRRRTRLGMSLHTISCLSICRILEPMQVLMSQSKTCGNDPRDALKRTLFNFHQRQESARLPMNPPTMLPQAEEKPKPQRKRQRKPPANSKAKKANLAQTPAAPANPPPFQGNQNIQPGFSGMGNYHHEVMVVGEPSMMGNDFGEEDERQISRIENAQYDPNAMQMQQQQQQLHPPQMGPIAPGMHPHGAQMGAPPMGNGAAIAQAMGPGGQMHPNVSMQPPQLQQIGQPINGTPQGYSYQAPPTSWSSQPPNTTMITG